MNLRKVDSRIEGMADRYKEVGAGNATSIKVLIEKGGVRNGSLVSCFSKESVAQSIAVDDCEKRFESSKIHKVG